MARLPVLHRKRRSRGQQAIDLAKSAAKAVAAVKVTQAGARTAKAARRPIVKVLAIPAAIAGGAAVWRKARGGGDGGSELETDRPLGPVATAETVSPPAAATPPQATTPPPQESDSPAQTPASP
jgi:hypothetical protein